ncbi:MAG: hypothetical protein ACI4TR_05080, partial [Bacteroidaceae bacterium]
APVLATVPPSKRIGKMKLSKPSAFTSSGKTVLFSHQIFMLGNWAFTFRSSVYRIYLYNEFNLET